MKCLATTTKVFLTAAALVVCLAPLAHAAQEGRGEADGVLRRLRGFPTELRELCLSYALYRYQAEDMGLQLGHPEMFSSHLQWDRFETKDVSSYIQISEGGKVAEEKDSRRSRWQEKWVTVRAARWVPSSGSATGTVTQLGGGRWVTAHQEGVICVGIILRGQRNMNTYIGCSGTSWFYHRHGLILDFVNGSGRQLQNTLAMVNVGDTVTVVVNDGQLSFEVNGALQGIPVDLPANIEVAMAVSLGEGAKVRLT